MKESWCTFIIYTTRDMVFENLEDWCDFIYDKEWQEILKNYRLRDVVKIEGKKVPIFEYNVWDEKTRSLAHFFKVKGIDFRPPKNSVPTKTRNELILYYYRLAKADKRNKICTKCKQAIKAKIPKCPFCKNDKFGDIKVVLKNLSKIDKNEPPEVKMLKPKEAAPDELNPAYQNTNKYRKDYMVLPPKI